MIEEENFAGLVCTRGHGFYLLQVGVQIYCREQFSECCVFLQVGVSGFGETHCFFVFFFGRVRFHSDVTDFGYDTYLYFNPRYFLSIAKIDMEFIVLMMSFVVSGGWWVCLVVFVPVARDSIKSPLVAFHDGGV